MLFHTWTFLAFLAVVLPVFFALKKTRLWLPWLMVASYVFYSWWNPYYLLLVAYSTALDYVLVTLMDQCPQKREEFDLAARLTRLKFENRVLKTAFIISGVGTLIWLGLAFGGPRTLRPTCGGLAGIFFLMALGAFFGSRPLWLVISIINNLAILLFFKYARFVIQNVQPLLNTMHLGITLPDPATMMPFDLPYALPVGISFFTFQSMSYTIDFYLGKVERERSFPRFATFVCFFPQLVAGPIERAREMLPQFQKFPEIRLQNLTDGMSLFLVGLF
jgi:alginate O-acetyltransferase complex protein AlgI